MPTPTPPPDPQYPWVNAGERPLGALWTPGSTTFRVYAHADSMRLRLVHPGSLDVLEQDLSPAPRDADTFEATVPGDLRGWSYSFSLRRGGRAIADIVDPWARLIRQDRAIVHHDDIPVAPRPPMDPADAVIYELHVRDFTRDPSSGVRHDWRGKYLGLIQSGTRCAGSEAHTALDHLLELGVNVVQLMPVHSFALPYHPEYEWGYMPMDYNAPHPGYAAGVEQDAPVREFKRLVSALHQRGIRVTLDVVYNHTFERWPGAAGADTAGKPAPPRYRSFMALASDEYFRRHPDGSHADGSACGNEFRSDSPMGRRFITESVKYWVHHYQVDGYRFDLMGLIDTDTMADIARELHAIDPTIMVYGEPWAGGPTPIEVNAKGKQRGRGWGVFNDDLRDALRGEVFKPEHPGFLASARAAGDKAAHAIKAGILGSVTTFADSPLESINYIECHDNHTLHDRLHLSASANTGPAARDRMSRLGALVLLTSRGVPFIHSGQEFGRSKNGHDNTYNLGDEVNNIPWGLKTHNHRLFEFHRRLIALRREHPMFRLPDRESSLASTKFLDDDLALALPPGVIAYMITDTTTRDPWAAAVIVMNGTDSAAQVPLPPGPWRTEIDAGHFSSLAPEKRSIVTGRIEAAPHSGSLLYRDR